MAIKTFFCVDAHTCGNPVRVVAGGGPILKGNSIFEKRLHFIKEYDWIRKGLMFEPRGSDIMSGSIIYPPHDEKNDVSILFIETSGCLPMCGHGTIGVGVTLAHLGRIGTGVSKLETPVGVVAMDMLDANTVTVENVPSYRYRRDVPVDVPGFGTVTGDIAWGGNWFFLVKDAAPCPLDLAHERELTGAALAIQSALWDQGITGRDDGEIDHVEFFGEPRDARANSRNFVLCPGGAYDRSPCGTGTSAKLACLADDDLLAPGTDWVQESVIGSHFTARYRVDGEGNLVPSITGRAFICAEGTLVQQAGDPFAKGTA